MNLVIVTHFFPPDGGPGSIRPHALATALHDLGHDVLVLTACQTPIETAFEVVSVPYTRLGGHIKRLTTEGDNANLGEMAARRGRLAGDAMRIVAHWTEAVFQHPDKYRGWVRAVERWWDKDGSLRVAPDAVIATTPPVSAALAGVALARRWKTALLLDFRDLWTESPYYRFGRLRRILDRRAESRLVAAANHLVAATEPLRRTLSAEHSRGDVRLIRTGVLPLPSAAVRPVGTAGGAMRVSHFGSMENWVRRDAGPVLLAGRSVVDRGEIEGSRLRFEFFGAVGEGLLQEIETAGVADLVKLHGKVPHERALQELAASDIALLLMWHGDLHSVPMKATEYLAGGKTVIVTGAAEDSEALRVLGGIEGVYFCNDQEAAEAVLLECWRRLSTGESLDWPEVERARPFLAGTMAKGFLDFIGAGLERS